MKNIFVYGSLMFDDAWHRIIQHHYENHAAVLSGYKRLSVKGKKYPGLVKSFNHSVAGRVYLNVTAQDIKRLDRYEGKCYKKIPVMVLSVTGREIKATAYLFKNSSRRLLGNRSWEPVQYQVLYPGKHIIKCRAYIKPAALHKK